MSMEFLGAEAIILEIRFPLSWSGYMQLQGARNERMTVLIRYALVYICLINFHYADARIPNFYGSVQLKIHSLVKLPCTPTVDDILEKYRHYRLEKDGLIADSTREMIKGLHSFFDKALPIMLLYKSERQQYEDTMAVMVAPSTIYGAEHLLRLFVKLPELLVHAKIEEETSTKLQQMLLDFLEFLQKNQSSFFLSTYHIAEDVETSTKEDD
ncbi:hypothetical protein Patl1_08881 [Pistacia atlantica]|uniref:Uncharacterized protein n=1 Tax=Pistacia atlantica TaxID=434234 RepID=A0ACC1AG75_9ROSI|nr:hypothetical protein Patl1_08881 [Pistacia atlantica]